MATNTTYEAGTLVHVAPTDLLIRRNIRDAAASPELVKSIKDVGVLEPITAVTTPEGLVVRYGHRRTLAAVEAKTKTVPVYVTGDDDTSDAAEIGRIIAQRDENTHRAGLTTADEVGVVVDLAAFGLKAAQITKRARIKRANVDAALAVADSELARKATEKYDNLTLDQAATVAEFEDDPETVKALIVAAHEGRFEHAAQRARDDRATERAKAEVLAALEAEGVTVIPRPGYDDERRILSLDRLATTADRATRKDVDPTGHTQCPGHVAWLDTGWVRVDADGTEVPEVERPDDDASEESWESYREAVRNRRASTREVTRPVAVYGCDGWKKNGHHDRHTHSSSGTTGRVPADQMSEEEREAAKAQRKLVVENNKAWAAAQPVRRAFLATFAKVKTPPKGTGRFIAEALAHDSHNGPGHNLASEWLGNKKGDQYGRPDLSPAKTATENKCLMVALVQVLASYEDNLADNTWRHDGTTNSTGRYLRFLTERCGYNASEVEDYAASNQTV